jgi:hypothetical protein
VKNAIPHVKLATLLIQMDAFLATLIQLSNTFFKINVMIIVLLIILKMMEKIMIIFNACPVIVLA